MYRFHELSTMVRAHPAEAAKLIMTECVRARGAEIATANALGVSTRTLRRWVGLLGLKERVDRVRELWLLRRKKTAKMRTKTTRVAARIDSK